MKTGKQVRIISVIIFFCLTTSAYSADKWSKTDIALESTYTVFHILDWKQTKQISESPYYLEINPILGEYPRINEVNRYFLSTLALHVVITHYLPSEYRKYWQLVTIGVEVGIVSRNVSIGLKISF